MRICNSSARNHLQAGTTDNTVKDSWYCWQAQLDQHSSPHC